MCVSGCSVHPSMYGVQIHSKVYVQAKIITSYQQILMLWHYSSKCPDIQSFAAAFSE